MSPTAVYSQTVDPTPLPSPTKGSALVIGSLSTAQDGKYQALIAELGEGRQVEKQILDRLVDGGTTRTTI